MGGEQPQLEYVGFWARVAASLVDTALLLALSVPLLALLPWRSAGLSPSALAAQLSGGTLAQGLATGSLLSGSPLSSGAGGLLFDWLLPAAAVIAFWMARQATPGKMLIRARIVDARTGGKPRARQAVARYLGYFVSTIPCGLGLLWVGLDRRKQGWHDKLAGTVVVRPRDRAVEPVRFGAD
ncbi:MAG: RDD family protein [Steroidobacteraceae bacterium]